MNGSQFNNTQENVASEDNQANGNDVGQMGDNASDGAELPKVSSEDDGVPLLGFDSRFKYPNV